MQLYLAKPGGKKQGPYTLEQVQRDLANGRYRDSDFWAWHEGLPQWMPLYEVPGVYPKPVFAAPAPAPARVAVASAPKPQPRPQPRLQPEPEPLAASPEAFEVGTLKDSTATQPAVAVELEEPAPVAAQPEEPAGFARPEIYSGLPFAALEQIFIFTSGDGRAVFESPIATQKLQEAVGQEFEAIRGAVFVDVIGNVNVGFEVMTEGAIPEKAWRAMSAIRPFLTRKAKEGAYQICVRPFPVETQDSVALFLLYDREKAQWVAA